MTAWPTKGKANLRPPFSAIEKAAYRGHLEIVQRLLEAGAQDRYGALVAACPGLHEDIVRWLLDTGVKPLNQLDGNHCTPLNALGRFHAEVRVPGTSRNLDSRRGRDSWLAELAEKQRSIAARLLEAGAGLEARDALGRTPLHAAVHNQTYQTVQAVDDDSYQLHQGHEVNPTSLVQLLLQSGADPNAVDRFGRTPIMLAAVRDSFMGPYFPGVAEALVAAGANQRLVKFCLDLIEQNFPASEALIQHLAAKQCIRQREFLDVATWSLDRELLHELAGLPADQQQYSSLDGLIGLVAAMSVRRCR